MTHIKFTVDFVDRVSLGHLIVSLQQVFNYLFISISVSFCLKYRYSIRTLYSSRDNCDYFVVPILSEHVMKWWQVPLFLASGSAYKQMHLVNMAVL